ncbi:hypothetical protein [Nostoc sp. 'Peltigera malacea cyanobiont' DB3992]|nr:hypothetical protein [Nostoc sp. 'Peltigera malacea cyanobiont' DB3992]
MRSTSIAIEGIEKRSRLLNTNQEILTKLYTTICSVNTADKWMN